MTKTIETAIAELSALGAGIHLFRPSGKTHQHSWHIRIEVNADGVKLEAQEISGPELEDVFWRVHTKFMRGLERGIPLAQLAPPVEAKATIKCKDLDINNPPPPLVDINGDDIPF